MGLDKKGNRRPTEITYVKSRSLPEVRNALASIDANDKAAGHLIWQLGEAGDFDAEADIARFLYSSDSYLRGLALSVLAFTWGIGRKYEHRFWQILREDPDIDGRINAALCIGLIYEGAANTFALRQLSAIVLDAGEDMSVRESVYEACMMVQGLQYHDWPLDTAPDLDHDPAWQQVLVHLKVS